MTYLVIDLVILGILALSALMGYRRGLILTLCGFLAVFVAFFGATAVSNTMSEPLSRTLQPGLESNIQRFLDDRLKPDDQEDRTPSIAGDPQEDEEHVVVSVEEALTLLKDTKIYRGFAEAFQEMVDKGMAAVTADAARVISEYIATQVARAVLFFLGFLLILVLWAMLSHALDLAFKLPVLSTLNAWCGALLGLLRGGVVLFIVCWLLGDGILPRDVVEGTLLLQFFCRGIPSLLLS